MRNELVFTGSHCHISLKDNSPEEIYININNYGQECGIFVDHNEIKQMIEWLQMYLYNNRNTNDG
jgi:hypothetical protein